YWNPVLDGLQQPCLRGTQPLLGGGDAMDVGFRPFQMEDEIRVLGGGEMECRQDRHPGLRQVVCEVESVHVHQVDAPALEGVAHCFACTPLRRSSCCIIEPSDRSGQRQKSAADT